MTTECLFRDDGYLREATARVLSHDERGIVLDRTIFYAQGGGQVGDTGVLMRENGERILVRDTRKGEGDDIVHLVDAAASPLAPAEGQGGQTHQGGTRRAHRDQRGLPG